MRILALIVVLGLLAGCASVPLREVAEEGDPGCKSLGSFEVSTICRGSLDAIRTCNETILNRIYAAARSRGGNAVAITGSSTGVAFWCPPEKPGEGEK